MTRAYERQRRSRESEVSFFFSCCIVLFRSCMHKRLSMILSVDCVSERLQIHLLPFGEVEVSLEATGRRRRSRLAVQTALAIVLPTLERDAMQRSVGQAEGKQASQAPGSCCWSVGRSIVRRRSSGVAAVAAPATATTTTAAMF